MYTSNPISRPTPLIPVIPARPVPRRPHPGTPYTCLDLACIPTSYAGRTLSVQLFDPGDGSGDIYVG